MAEADVDVTGYAEKLISTIARAFYEDDVVCLIDVLLRDKFLRDDDMALRLSLPAKQLRKTLISLEEEHLVKHELVDDLAMGGSQNSKFWYIDYNQAVHVIRLRIHLLQKKLTTDELRARSSSLYLCPGYASRTCNGEYNETDAQQIVDPETGLFLCRECVRAYVNHPNPPDKSEYTLTLVDNQKKLKGAMDNMRRVRVQLSGKVDSTQQPLRLGVFDLLQKVRLNRGGEPITSNLPSENIAREIGSKRLEGTGRTYGNLLKKRKDAGIGIGGRRGTEEGHEDELTFLKNAMGQEIAFELERGSGARANLLATKGRIRNKLVDAAAMVVGVDLGVVTQVIFEAKERRALAKKRKMEEKEEGAAGGGKKKKKKKGGSELYFLKDNLDVTSSAIGGAGAAGLSKDEKEKRRLGYLGGDNDNDSSSDDEGDDEKESFFVTDETDELRNLPEDERRILFQAQYKIEVERQKKLLGITTSPSQSHPGIVSDENWDDGAENGAVEWEDG